MKGVALILLAQVACSLAFVLRETVPDCGPGSPTHIPHPTDCNAYYTCANGVPILEHCAPGLWWSPAIEGCDLPEHVECAANGSTSIGTTAVPTIAPPDCGPGSPTHIPHPTDCSKYYTCDDGVAILQECPPGLWWNVALETCDFPENVECAAAITSTIAVSTTAEPTTPTTTTPTTTALPLCGPGSPTHVPHPTDCSKYYTCDEGVPILQECPPGLWWNVAVESCDFPENVECAAAGSTTAAPPPTEATFH